MARRMAIDVARMVVFMVVPYEIGRHDRQLETRDAPKADDRYGRQNAGTRRLHGPALLVRPPDTSSAIAPGRVHVVAAPANE